MQIYTIDQVIVRCFVFVAVINLFITCVSLVTLSEHGLAGAAVVSHQLSGTISIYAFLACLYACARTAGSARLFSAALLTCFAIVMQVENGSTFVGLRLLPFAALTTAVLLVILIEWQFRSSFLSSVAEIQVYLASRSAVVLLIASFGYILAKLCAHFAASYLTAPANLVLKQAVLLSMTTLFIYSVCPYLKRGQ